MEPVAKKTYYAIGEVSAITGLKPHVLRYWETQFDIVSPAKHRKVRVYQESDIEAILLVRNLMHDRGFTTAGANREIQRMRDSDQLAEVGVLNAEPAVLASIREAVERLRDELTPPEPADEEE